jgi:hypothetical protein
MMPDNEKLEPLLKEHEVEAILRVARGWAAKDRCYGATIPFLKIGKSVRYRERDVRAYINGCVRQSSTEDEAQPLRIEQVIVGADA